MTYYKLKEELNNKVDQLCKDVLDGQEKDVNVKRFAFLLSKQNALSTHRTVESRILDNLVAFPELQYRNGILAKK